MQTGRRLAAIAAGSFVLGVALVASPPAARAATIQELVAAQQKGFCSGNAKPPCPTDQLFIPPVPNYTGWSGTPNGKFCRSEPDRCRFALVDYAGIAAAYIKAHGGPDLHTTFKGVVRENPIGHGKVEVSLRLETHNALTFVSELPADAKVFTGPHSVFATAPLLFGSRVSDVLHGEKPALGDSVFRLRFVQDAGAPLPNLALVVQGREAEFESLQFHATATGKLRAAAGKGLAGKPGRARVIVVPGDTIAVKPL